MKYQKFGIAAAAQELQLSKLYIRFMIDWFDKLVFDKLSSDRFSIKGCDNTLVSH